MSSCTKPGKLASFVGVSILLLSTNLLLNFGTVLTLWHFFLFFMLWFNLLVGRYMSYYLCLYAYNDVHHILCCGAFFCFFFVFVLCLVYGGVKHILCCVFCFVCLRLVSCVWWCQAHMVLCFLFCLSSSCVLHTQCCHFFFNCLFLISFSNVYFTCVLIICTC